MNKRESMRALTVRAGGHYQIENLPMPSAGEGEVIIKVDGCGVCAGDLKSFSRAKDAWSRPDSPDHSVPGHEFFGTVHEIGAQVSEDLDIGDRVIAEQIVPCWDCRFCNTGHYWMCRESNIFGFRGNPDGGMAEYMKLPKGSRIHKLPQGMPLEKAALIEPYACAKHCVDRGNVGNEDVVVLSGAGALGLGMLGVLKLKNPAQIIVLDMRDDRLALAEKFGADVVLNPGKVDAVQEVKDRTEGYGCDVYIEATGFGKSVEQGLNMIRNLGTFVEFGVFNEPTSVNWSIIGDRKELNVLGSHLGPYCYPAVIDWLQKDILPSQGVVTHVYPLQEWDEAFRMARDNPEAIKVVITP